MISLNDYLYSGDTIFRILRKYTADLLEDARGTNNPIDLVHCNFLLQITELLEHNDFLTSQSQRIREFYNYMVREYPELAFTFRGRIKSLIRAEEKFNGYIVEYIYEYYKKNKTYPDVPDLKSRLSCFRDLIAYRIVISLPKCHARDDAKRREAELDYLYRIAGALPPFLEERGFSLELANAEHMPPSDRLPEIVRPYYRDYISTPSANGYQSLHITLYDNIARCYIEVQLRTKEMDDHAEIGPANHLGYEKRQERQRAKRTLLPTGECIYFDDAYERVTTLQNLDLAKIDVNMFSAIDNSLINDGCGLFRGRLILPFEHLSRFQTGYVES